ncbi:hypothetical protein [Micromonospora craniellae]|uniref:Uncharacterized protein n=1 Tax=Micromonospora craniellae TaxID=2294034 RepID=A0A372G2D6_9ACTN|nr:hypothetical protein [Micromonospora craniellae]QOC92789.1 hypothetical protein ID554_03265 [Micromonospora craniellae]RFS46936.1 hypothetical protein D0Q02_09165 [Micromonospora craniellae]
MRWEGHWHGFGPWVGSRADFAKEGPRRPGADLGDAETQIFLANTMTPVLTGHWLLRRNQAAAERTWTDVADATAWMRQVREANPAAGFGGPLLTVQERIERQRTSLVLGSDVAWGYYTPAFSYVSFAAVCCPNRFLPGIVCPSPPRT